jgi:hypothetical protein
VPAARQPRRQHLNPVTRDAERASLPAWYREPPAQKGSRMANNQRHCVLSLNQVDELNDVAHQIVLHSYLMVAVLEDYATRDVHLEGVHKLASETITHARVIEAFIEQGCRAAKQGVA